ncbi:DegT/DnrJ/EryC1/StrS family aminotransferase [Massilia sp. GCM10020059]|uniref:Aminotransferase class I/II-fold pyridoxal phosphate-dependent enzyme n=1 Tax=Massilia agrisoli TaxID=2892444 RepID=A0ABS8IQD0_9BURK|nr:DegT/DnrJ/EryC1/StrS family aminotransferase [Massilia agrisoli]MCC6069958.1 aminotransferase class I/II-fold pyridoxal phosphate-dependent enzyme [Massilia agrisoli]
MKNIRTAADLAVNGATPAFEQMLHVGRPNMGDREAFMQYAADIFDRRWLSNNGPLVQEFEAEVAQHLGVKHCVAMCNGTIALEIAIRALGLEGEVIVPSYTFVATAHALQWQSITPVFADVDPATHALSPAAVRRMITPRTSGIIGVHLWGRGAPVAELQDIADEHGLKLMFDAAHAFSCTYQGRMIGSFGACEVLSFHATKFFNTFEGGAVVTNDDTLAEAMRLMRNFGFVDLDKVIHPGTNGKMIEIAAAMGLVNLRSLDAVIAANRRNYLAYREALSDVKGVRLLAYDETERNNYQYVVLEVDDACAVGRDALVAALRAENVMARRYFWPGCHNLEPYRSLFPHAGLVLPATDAVARSVIVLPTGQTMDADMIATVAQIIRTAINAPA